MKTMTKPLLFTGVAMALVVFIVFVAAHFWLGSSRSLDWVQSRINASIPGTITIDSHRLSLLTPDLDLYGATLHDNGGIPLAGFDHLHVRLNWWALLRREVRLESILLQAPWADLVVHGTSGLNLMNALVRPSGETPTDIPLSGDPGILFNLVVVTAQMSDGRISYGASDDTSRMEADGITLTAGGNLTDRSGHLELDMADAAKNEADALEAEIRSRGFEVEGVVDTEELPLNVSREMIQSSPAMDRVRFIRPRLHPPTASLRLIPRPPVAPWTPSSGSASPSWPRCRPTPRPVAASRTTSAPRPSPCSRRACSGPRPSVRSPVAPSPRPGTSARPWWWRPGWLRSPGSGGSNSWTS